MRPGPIQGEGGPVPVYSAEVFRNLIKQREGWQFVLNGMDEAAERPEEQARATPRRQDVESGLEAGSNAQDMGMGALLEQYEDTQHTQLRRGELVEGTVVLVDRDEILVDIGGKMEAVIATGEIQNERGELALRRGDHVSAVVIVPENAEGRPVISINRARAEIGWGDLQTQQDATEGVTAEGVHPQ